MFGRSSATPEPLLRVLYDGAPLCSASGSPAASHLIELLEHLPAGVEPWLASPWVPDSLPGNSSIRTFISQIPNTTNGWTRWEQFLFPRAAREIGAKLLHTTQARPPFNSPVPCLVSPANILLPTSLSAGPSFLGRLRDALGAGGLSAAWAILWPDDLPAPSIRGNIISMPPTIHSAFLNPQPDLPDIPRPYVLCPLADHSANFQLIEEVWGVVSSTMGEDWHLILLDEMPGQMERFPQMPSTHFLIPSSIEESAALYQQAEVVLHVCPVAPWGDPLSRALACTRPIAGFETVWSSARSGPAAYLVPDQNTRALAAALITLLVKSSVAQQLSYAAEARSAGWRKTDPAGSLWSIYKQAAGQAG